MKIVPHAELILLEESENDCYQRGEGMKTLCRLIIIYKKKILNVVA